MTEFKLPNLGDGVAAGDVLRVLVKVGDTLAADQAVLELETDKATLEVPSTVGGRVAEIKVKQGDKVKPGQVVLVLEDAAGAAASPAAAAPAAAAPAPAKASIAAADSGPGQADGPIDRPMMMAASGPARPTARSTGR